MYIYIDESGELGNKSKYFVIGFIAIDDPKKISRIISKTKQKYKKQLGNFQEIKGNKTKNHIMKKF